MSRNKSNKRHAKHLWRKIQNITENLKVLDKWKDVSHSWIIRVVIGKMSIFPN